MIGRDSLRLHLQMLLFQLEDSLSDHFHFVDLLHDYVEFTVSI